jgi:hypothetical protein
MIKRIIPVVLAAFIISSCGNKTGKEVSADRKAVKVEFASLVSNPADYIDKDIVVEGKVVHVCKETGKKLFIVGDDPDIRLFISAGENIPKFPMDLLGSSITVEGRIERVVTASKPAEVAMAASLENAATCDSAKKATMECAATCAASKLEQMAEASPAKTGPECETEAALAKQTVLGDLMMVYAKHEIVK